MRPILILQTGNPPRDVKASHGGFEAMVQAQGGLQPADTAVVKVYAGEVPREPAAYSAAIITGSPANVTDHDDWSVATADWVRGAVAADLPVLGICYGHQLMAEALGGKVDFHPAGRESGTQRVERTPAAAHDVLARALPDRFEAQFIHEQSVMTAPPGAVVLARNAHDAHQMLRFAPRAWGVQFHPEFSAAIMRTYVEVLDEMLSREGADVPALLAGVQDTDASTAVLRTFVQTFGQGAGAAATTGEGTPRRAEPAGVADGR